MITSPLTAQNVCARLILNERLAYVWNEKKKHREKKTESERKKKLRQKNYFAALDLRTDCAKVEW